MTNGRGFIGVAAMYFGGVSPITTWLASLFFGFTEGVGARLQNLVFPPSSCSCCPMWPQCFIVSMIRQRPRRIENHFSEKSRGENEDYPRVDPGHDDAVVILVAAKHESWTEGITVVAATGVEKTLQNAPKVCSFAGIDVPVYAGRTTFAHQ